MSRRQQLLNQGLKRPKFTEDEGCRIVGERFHSNSFIFRQPNNASDETIRFPNDANPNTQRNHNATNLRAASQGTSSVRNIYRRLESQKNQKASSKAPSSSNNSFAGSSIFKNNSQSLTQGIKGFSEKFSKRKPYNRFSDNYGSRSWGMSNKFSWNNSRSSSGNSLVDFLAKKQSSTYDQQKAIQAERKYQANKEKVDKRWEKHFQKSKNKVKSSDRVSMSSQSRSSFEKKREQKEQEKGAPFHSGQYGDLIDISSDSGSPEKKSYPEFYERKETDQQRKKHFEKWRRLVDEEELAQKKQLFDTDVRHRYAKDSHTPGKISNSKPKLSDEKDIEEYVKQDKERRAFLYKHTQSNKDSKIDNDIQNMEKLFNKDFKDLEHHRKDKRLSEKDMKYQRSLSLSHSHFKRDISNESIAEKEKYDRERRNRYEHRRNDGPFVKKILDLKLFSKPKVSSKEIPIKFNDYMQYYKVWMPLFEYEVYSQLISMRKEGSKSKLADVCYTASLANYTIQGMLKSPDRLFFSLLMCAPNNEIVKYENRAPQKLKTRKSIQKERFSNNLEWSKIFNQVRENDLIYLSNKRLEKKEEKFNFAAMKPYNLFQFCNPELGGALGVVNKRMKKSGNVIEVKFSYDIKDPLTSLCKRMQDDNQDFFVYYITNLSTVIREYLALKSIEFSKFVNAILDPLKYKEILSKRMTLRELNNKKYNDSQNEALRYVASMNTGGLSLIQGPPGTGKTHTIHGILNMFVETRVEPNFKILVCTPSNAACDELVSRLGRETERRQGLVYKMVRIGAFDYEPPMIVKKYTLDEMVKRELKKTGRKIDFTDIDKKCKEMDILGVEMDKIEKNIKKSTEEEKVDLKQKHEQIKIKRGKLMGETNLLRQQKSQSKINASSIEESIVRHADFIFTTLSMSGVELLDKMDFKFSHLIIDEASQATEISALIPFCHDVNKVILVGDQNQLPATVFSENAEKTLFNRSLYERFLGNEIECFTLNIQYRMQSIIREFPNNQFYDGKIVDDPSINKRILDRTKEKCPKLAFFNLEFTECDGGVSKSNRKEAEFVAGLFMEQLFIRGDGSFGQGLEAITGKVGVITPYRKQSDVIKDCLIEALLEVAQEHPSFHLKNPNFLKEGAKEEINKIIQVSTVDSFQGKEKDTIIISLVRVSKASETSIGFLHDYRRMNVALTRAQNFLWVIGHAPTLNSNKNWGDFIRFCFKKRCVKTISKEPPAYKIVNGEKKSRYCFSEIGPIDESPNKKKRRRNRKKKSNTRKAHTIINIPDSDTQATSNPQQEAILIEEDVPQTLSKFK